MTIPDIFVKGDEESRFLNQMRGNKPRALCLTHLCVVAHRRGSHSDSDVVRDKKKHMFSNQNDTCLSHLVQL